MAEGTEPDWRSRAVNAFRIQGLATRLRDLINVDVDIDSIQLRSESAKVVLDDITFLLNANGNLEIVAPCPHCRNPKAAMPATSLPDVGHAIDSLCRDCEFLVRSGLLVLPDQPRGRPSTGHHK